MDLGGSPDEGLMDSGVVATGCVGTPDPAVRNLCASLEPGSMACSPVDGCNSVMTGSCVARQTLNECYNRGVGNCGFGLGANACQVVGDSPSNFTCVQTQAASQCGTHTDSEACDPAEGSSACNWATPLVCAASPCSFYPSQSFCENVAGCSWR